MLATVFRIGTSLRNQSADSELGHSLREVSKTGSVSKFQTYEKVDETQKNLKDTIKAKINRRNLSAAPFYLNGAIQINNASNVHLGNSVSIGNNPSIEIQKPPEPKPELSPALTALFENEEEVTNLHRLAVDSHIGSDWRFLGQELAGFSNGQMDQLEEPFKANHYEFREVIYQMLLMWEGHCETTPTVGMLATALWKCKMYSAVISLLERVKDSHK
ncbi:Receptor-interacting serine/threonine-protein kinase [Daphnia magna]|uniref:Receptor-interacting serine/threonine-protein kinase n=1 Tax=Daphnia magna TaxID=35525 RepID=A0A162NIB1_9CRUS|nr:Receptor-interacting serine/threonine-protein kinase [Daphnia magna]